MSNKTASTASVDWNVGHNVAPKREAQRGTLWPDTLHHTDRPPRLIYLDLNHWIELAKALSGHRDGTKHRLVLDACISAVADGEAIFPLSAYIYAEISKIANHRQRRDLREVIELVCRHMVVTPLTIVVAHEVEALLDKVLGPRPLPLSPTSYLDWGVERAFGKVGGLRIKSADGHDITEQFRRTYPRGPAAFDRVLLDAQLELNRRSIEGPTLQEEPRLRDLGWNPEAIVRVYEQKASDELAQARRFDSHPNFRVGRTRDVITAREAIVEIGDIFNEGFEHRGGIGAAEEFFSVERDELTARYDSMSSFNVSVTLKTSLHRDANHKWRNNDFYDIGALALTIPYCDVVLTDRSMLSHVDRHNLSRRYRTVVLSRLDDLPTYL